MNHLNVQEFLNLTEIEQQDAIQANGKLLISCKQGNSQTDLYKLDGLFIKILQFDDGSRQAEAFFEIDGFKLYEDKL